MKIPGVTKQWGQSATLVLMIPAKTVSSSCVPLGIERERERNTVTFCRKFPLVIKQFFTNVLSMFNNANFHAGDVWAPYLPKKWCNVKETCWAGRGSNKKKSGPIPILNCWHWVEIAPMCWLFPSDRSSVIGWFWWLWRHSAGQSHAEACEFDPSPSASSAFSNLSLWPWAKFFRWVS